MDTRRLSAFVKIVDTGSLTRAADNLHVAQPALSQQVAALEAQFRQRLLIRSKRGVMPTEAGRALYRHAQIILRQLGQAHAEVGQGTQAIAGNVSLGLAPYSAGAALALPLLQRVRERFPGILLHINENFGGVISELVMTGKMDMALIYQPGPIRGVKFEPMFEEALCLLASPQMGIGREKEVALAALEGMPLLLPSRIHTIRRLVESAFERAGLVLNVVAEIESATTLASAVDASIGATVLPLSSALSIAETQRRVSGRDLAVTQIVQPSLSARVSICLPDHLAPSDAAQAVHDLIVELVHSGPFAGSFAGKIPGGVDFHPPA